MIKKTEIKDWLDQIDKILLADYLKKDDELRNIFLKARRAIKNGERDALARLSNSISWYLVTHRYEAPKPVIEFAQQIVKEPNKERGKLAFLQMLALSLAQM